MFFIRHWLPIMNLLKTNPIFNDVEINSKTYSRMFHISPNLEYYRSCKYTLFTWEHIYVRRRKVVIFTPFYNLPQSRMQHFFYREKIRGMMFISLFKLMHWMMELWLVQRDKSVMTEFVRRFRGMQFLVLRSLCVWRWAMRRPFVMHGWCFNGRLFKGYS